MRIFLTGIDGFVGRHLAARLAAVGHAVEGSALEPDVPVDGADRVVALDVRDADAVARAVADVRPDALVHLAGQTSVPAAFADPAGTFETNALGTLHVLEACRAAGTARVLVVSSSEVYGDRDPADGPVPETAPLAPVTPYGASKAAQDLLAQQYARWDVPVVRVRAFPHTGPGQEPRFVFPSVARRVALAEAGLGPAEIEVGWLGATRDLTDVRDVARAYERLLELGRPGEAYNVCSGRGRTIEQALAPILAAAEVPVRLVPHEDRLRPTEVTWIVGDPTRLREETGWVPEFEWEETARDLLEDARDRVDREAGRARQRRGTG